MSTVVCCARALGYGPASKLHVIAEALHSHGLRTSFVGTGPAYEFAQRAGIGTAIDAAPDARGAREAIASADAVLSLMDQDALRVARELGKRTFVVDSLFWMRDHIPEDFVASTRYWVQDFIGVRERADQTPTGAIVVGPVVRRMTPSTVHVRRGLVIQLGGLASPYLADGLARRYAEFCIDGVLASGILRSYGDGALVMGGTPCIAHLERRYPGRGLRFVSLSHLDAMHYLRRAAAVVTAPGLTAALECFQLAIPTFFLPPQNFSQWWILHRLRERDLAPQSFHWQDTLVDDPVTFHVSETERVPLVRDLLGRALDDERTVSAFRAALEAIPSVPPAELASRQREFFAALGSNAVATIAGEIAALC